MDTHRCMKPVTSGTKMPGVSGWVWIAARTSVVPNQIGKKNVFWSWVVGGLQNLLELVEFRKLCQ